MSSSSAFARTPGSKASENNASESKGGWHIRSPSSAEELRAEVRRSSDRSSQAAHRLIESLGASADREPTLKPLATAIGELIHLSSQLPYQDYRTVVGLVHTCREDDSGLLLDGLVTNRGGALDRLTPAARSLFAAVRPIVAAAEEKAVKDALVKPSAPGFPPSFYHGLSDDLMLVLRTVYPLGVNIKTPSMDAREGAFGYPADKRLGFGIMHGSELTVAAGMVEVRPSRHERASVLKFIPPGATWDTTPEQSILRPGESIIVGRSISLPSPSRENPDNRALLGVPLAERTRVDAELYTDSTLWSRGGLLVYRGLRDEQVLIFDRGMLHNVGRPDDVGGIETYIPRTIVNIDGSVGFGESRIFRRGGS